jgi:hypothetical protein
MNQMDRGVGGWWMVDGWVDATDKGRGRRGIFLHAEIDASELLHTGLDGFFQAGWASHVDGSDAEHFGAGTRGHERLGHGFGLFDVAAHNAGIGSQMDHCSYLGTADGAVATCAENHFVVCDG